MKGPGGGLNIKMSSYQYKDPNVKDNTVLRPSYLYHGIIIIPGRTVFILRCGPEVNRVVGQPYLNLRSERSTINSQVRSEIKLVTLYDSLTLIEGNEYRGHTYNIGWNNITLSYITVTGLILGLWPANERRHYKVTPSLIGSQVTLIL